MWYDIKDSDTIATPALAVYPDRIAHNIQLMLSTVGGDVARLCPHVKTHKMARVMQMYLDHGVRQFKCATIAELEMVASCSPDFVLIAYQLVGPNADRFVQLANRYPDVEFATVIDSHFGLQQLAKAAEQSEVSITVLLDLDVGMMRTGIAIGDDASEIYQQIATLPRLKQGGLHAYDGHIHAADFDQRTKIVQSAFQGVQEFVAALRDKGALVPRVIAGGTPSFPVHAMHQERICSPGTTIFWDSGYTTELPDMKFLPAAVLLTRVISKPTATRVCLDLGHKAVSADKQPPRSHFPLFPDAQEVEHSEEHLVLEGCSDEVKVGDLLYAIPRHICPTVALHREVLVVDNGRVSEHWAVTARDRKITV